MQRQTRLKRSCSAISRTANAVTGSSPWTLCVGAVELSKQVITVEPDKRSGKPCVRGMRVTVSDVLDYLASGMTPDEIVNEFPYFTPDDIRACLAFAAERKG